MRDSRRPAKNLRQWQTARVWTWTLFMGSRRGEHSPRCCCERSISTSTRGHFPFHRSRSNAACEGLTDCRCDASHAARPGDVSSHGGRLHSRCSLSRGGLLLHLPVALPQVKHLANTRHSSAHTLLTTRRCSRTNGSRWTV